MDEGDSAAEFDVEKIIKRVEADEESSPSARARRVYDCLQATGRFTTWDLLCFSAEYIGRMAGTLEWLQPPAKSVIRLVYIAHYIRFEMHEWLDSKTLAQESPKTESDTTPGQ